MYICHTLWFRSILGRFTCMLDWICIKCTLLPTRCSVALADFYYSPFTLSQGCKIDRIELRKSTEGCPTKMVFPPQTGHSLVVVSVGIYFAELGGNDYFYRRNMSMIAIAMALWIPSPVLRPGPKQAQIPKRIPWCFYRGCWISTGRDWSSIINHHHLPGN